MDEVIVSGNQVSYKDFYDKFWIGLLLVDKIQDEKNKVFLYVRLGRYYSFYKWKDEVL